jgi:uncharacterized protein (DUF983 family)
MSEHQQVSPFIAGLKCRCPRCGRGALFDGFLTVRPVCSVCGLDLAAADSGDGPAVFIMFVVGPVVTGLALWVEVAFSPPYWLHLVLWIPAILGGSLALLRPFKATLIALQYRHRASDSGTQDFGDQE